MAEHFAEDAEFGAVAAILRTVCKAAIVNLTPDTHLDELPDMDSLRVLQVIALLEEQFSVEIDAATVDRMSSLRDVLTCLRAAKRAAGLGS